MDLINDKIGSFIKSFLVCCKTAQLDLLRLNRMSLYCFKLVVVKSTADDATVLDCWHEIGLIKTKLNIVHYED